METTVRVNKGLRTVVIADRSAHMRETLRRVLGKDNCSTVVAEAGTLREALRAVRTTGANVIILDVDLVIHEPAARLRRIAASLPGLRVVVLLNEDLPGYRRAIAERWGYDCVAKERAESELTPALALPKARHRTAGNYPD
jgi:DNA-binding NarL/FixJ family response regulator